MMTWDHEEATVQGCHSAGEGWSWAGHLGLALQSLRVFMTALRLPLPVTSVRPWLSAWCTGDLRGEKSWCLQQARRSSLSAVVIQTKCRTVHSPAVAPLLSPLLSSSGTRGHGDPQMGTVRDFWAVLHEGLVLTEF